MNALKSSLLAATALVAFGCVNLIGSPEVGKPAPDFTLTDIEGKSYHLADLKGKTVVLEWTNPGCPVVGNHYTRSGNIPALQRKATADGVVWLAIQSSKKGNLDATQVKSWLSKNKAEPTAYLNDGGGTVAKLYDARTTPHMYVINPAGTLVYNGAIDSAGGSGGDPEKISRAENYVAAALAAVKSGTMPAKTSSQPYGCSVKY